MNALELNLEAFKYKIAFIIKAFCTVEIYIIIFFSKCFEKSFENISGSVLRGTTVVHHGSLL